MRDREHLKKQRPREPIPREGQQVSIKKRKDGRFSVYVAIKGTPIKFKSTVSSLADANEKALDFLAGIGPESRAAECTESTRASPRNHVPSVPMPRRSYNKTNHVPGPGRGIHEPTTRASALIKAEQINLAKALVDGLISSDFQSAEEIYEKAFAVTEHHSQLAGSKIDEALRAAVQLTVRGRKDPIQQRSDRQVRRHKAAVKLAIMEQAGTRPEDQIAIAQAVLADLQGSLSSQQQKTASQIMQEDMKSKHDKAAKDFIIKSVQKTIALLKSKIPKGGRRTHADRIVMQTVVGATMREVPPGLQQAACRILDVDRRHVPLLRNLWDNYEASNEPTAVPFIQKEQGGEKPYR